VGLSGSGAGKRFFFEKKKQKTFDMNGPEVDGLSPTMTS
jgi:hypothetical protein